MKKVNVSELNLRLPNNWNLSIEIGQVEDDVFEPFGDSYVCDWLEKNNKYLSIDLLYFISDIITNFRTPVKHDVIQWANFDDFLVVHDVTFGTNEIGKSVIISLILDI